MKRWTGNHKHSHVFVVGTAPGSRKIVSWLAQSGQVSGLTGGCARLGPLSLVRGVEAELGVPGAVGGTCLTYVDDDTEGPSIPSRPSARSSNHEARVAVLFESDDRTSPIDQIMVVKRDLTVDRMLDICVSLHREGHEVLAASPAFNVVKRNGRFSEMDGLGVVFFASARPSGWHRVLKKIMDLIGAVIGAIIFLPIFLVVAVLIKLTSAGPVFFRQARIGKNGKPFTFYKFRSMVSGDDSKHREYLKAFVEDGREAAVDENGRKVYKITDDPRITPFGRFLRKTSLDEFPQIINVLKGDMSLVGPRPCLPYEWELYEDWQKERLSVTPGLTGLWQVTGRSNVSFRDMVVLDLYYISNWSFWWDLKLIFQTIPVILLGKGAH